MRASPPFLCLAATALAGCATAPPPPQPEIIVYGGPPNDPRFQIPERFRIQPRLPREQWAGFQQEAAQVHQVVRSDPAFGGFILRWSPEPHAVVMFTGDAQARLRRYTSDPRFRAQSVDLTLAELERHKSEMTAQLGRLGIPCITVDGDEEHNRVTVTTPEVEKVRRLIAQRRIKVPPKFALLPGGCPQLR